MSNNNNQPPPWSEAPPLAKWRCQDFDGVWCFFENEPMISYSGDWWDRRTDGDLTIFPSGQLNPDWKTTLQKRPDNE